MDDFRSGDIPFNRLLRYLDRYPCGVPVKGGRVPFNPRLIVITCPRVPRDEFVRHADGLKGTRPPLTGTPIG